MSRTLTRPMFRKGGEVKRSNYMGGGIKAVRPRYMGGGMTGIMSGIVPDAGLTPRIGFQEGTTMFNKFLTDTPFGRELQKIATATNRNIADVVTAVYDMGGVPANKITEFFTGANPGFSGTRFTQQIPIIGDSISERDPDKAYFFGATTDATPKSGIFAGKEPIDTKPKTPPGGGDPKMRLSPLDTIGGEKNIKDEETALMKAYKEYAPIFEKELGVSDEDTKKSLYMNLAKFGAGILAQPGGDLVGAIGKAAEKPLEGASATLKEKTDAKRQAKLLALQTAISEGKPGTIGKAIKDIAKVYKVSEKEAAKIYEKWNENTSTAQAADTKAYRDFAKEKNVNPEGFTRNIKKLLASDDADLVGKFNKKLPMDDGVPDVDEIVDKEYYIGEGGELYRADKSTDPPTLLEPGDPGFKDSKKGK